LRGSTTISTGLMAAVLALAGGLSFGVSAAGARAIPPNIDISQARGNEAENAIAVNPTNPQNLVTMSTLSDAAYGLFEAVSFDGGQSWTTRIIGDGDRLGKACCDEQLAFDRFGNLWMAYLRNHSKLVPIGLSTDGGKTFKRAAAVSLPVAQQSESLGSAQPPKGAKVGADHPAPDQPSIATGPHSVWVSFTSYPSKVVQASGARVSGLGVHGEFTTPESVPTTAGRGNYGDTAVGPGGEVMAIYQSKDGGESGAKIYTALDPDGLGPAGFTNPRFLAHTNVGGFDYIPAKPNRSIDAEASLAWDRSGGPYDGRVYATFVQERGDESNDTNVLFQHSDDGGATWTSPARLNDDHGTTSQFDEAIAVDQATGFLGVAWYDARNDLGAGGPGDTDGLPNDDVQIWATLSRSGGASFVPNFQVSEGTSSAPAANDYFDFGDYTHAAFQSHRFYTLWSDNSNSTGDNPDGTLHEFDLYTAKVAVP